MDKPIVFLSHSSKDSATLTRLKGLLDRRAVGSLKFFLSSDGQSIPLGSNWVVAVSDAMDQAKLMFLFLSPQSADSRWIHFEAGSAYAKGIKVVPVCLPGLDLNRVNPPLSLLQGFNLHTNQAMSNIARRCNETFGLTMEEEFSAEEFNTVFAESATRQQGFFGEFAPLIDNITFEAERVAPNRDAVDPAREFAETCKMGGIQLITSSWEQNTDVVTRMEWPGGFVQMGFGPATGEKSNTHKRGSIYGQLSPELFHVNAPLVDTWLKSVAIRAEVRFEKGILAEDQRLKLSTRLYGTDVHLAADPQCIYEGLAFKPSNEGGAANIQWDCAGKLYDERLPKIVEVLFATKVLTQIHTV